MEQKIDKQTGRDAENYILEKFKEFEINSNITFGLLLRRIALLENQLNNLKFVKKNEKR